MERRRHLRVLERLLTRHRAVAILGARQVGKTTLARQIAARFRGPTAFFDLENPDDLARLAEPTLRPGALQGLVVIDEIQRRPDLFPVLRVLDRSPAETRRFLVLGSASPICYDRRPRPWPAGSSTTASKASRWRRSGNETSTGSGYVAGSPAPFWPRPWGHSAEWRRGFVQTFLERDLPQLGIRVPAATLRRFWSMLGALPRAGVERGEFARSFGVSDVAVRRYLDTLAATFVVRVRCCHGTRT